MQKPLLLRILFGMIVGLLMAIPFSEFAFRWQGNTTSRPPKTVVLDIPPGTAEEVGQGKTVIPESMTFVAGDVLLVQNRDSVLHTLGPLVIPPGSSATLPLNNVGNLSVICSFEPTNYLGLDIFEPLTLSTPARHLHLRHSHGGFIHFIQLGLTTAEEENAAQPHSRRVMEDRSPCST